MKEHILKDEIIKLLIKLDGKEISISDIAGKFKCDYYYVSYCVDDLIDNDFIKHFECSSKDDKPNEKMIWIHHRGRFFLNQSGGYTHHHKEQRRNHNWIIAKTISAALNAIAILFIGYWGVKVADKSNKLEKAEQEIEKLKHENDSLRAIHYTRLPLHR